MIYLASPYTHPDAFIREQRYVCVLKVLHDFLVQRKWAYSPIVHCHEAAKVGSLPPDAEFWEEYDFHMLALAESMTVVMLPDWEKSRGVEREIEFCRRELGIPIVYLNPDRAIRD